MIGDREEDFHVFVAADAAKPQAAEDAFDAELAAGDDDERDD